MVVYITIFSEFTLKTLLNNTDQSSALKCLKDNPMADEPTLLFLNISLQKKKVFQWISIITKSANTYYTYNMRDIALKHIMLS